MNGPQFVHLDAHCPSTDDVIDCLDLLASAADALAAVTLATLPTVPEGKYGITICGMRRQPDGTYEGDPIQS